MTISEDLFIDTFKVRLNEILTQDHAVVIAIKGKWGVGKTYFWERYIEEIFENSVSLDLAGKPITVHSFLGDPKSVTGSALKKSHKVLVSMPALRDFSGIVDMVSFLSVRDTIVVVDDLERAGKGLSAKDALGLISYLKEQRNCKVVLLMNDGEDGMEDYQKHREKVVDIELGYNPSVGENANIVFDDDTPIFRIAKEYAIKLDSTNIRTLTKTKRYLESLSEVLDNKHEEIQSEIVSSVVLYTLSYYRSENNRFPTFDFLLKWTVAYGYKNKEEISVDEKNWCDLLRDYGYSPKNPLDKEISQGIETGLFDLEKISELVSSWTQEITKKESAQEFRDAWRLYHDTFDDNQDELVSQLKDSLNNNAKNISPTDLHATVELLKHLDLNDDASHIIERYISENRGNNKVFDLNTYYRGDDVTDSDIRDAFASEFEKNRPKPSLSEIMQRLASKSSWSKADERQLAKFTKEEYVELFETHSGEILDEIITAGLRFKPLSKKSEENTDWNRIGERVVAALVEIGSRSKLNQRRVSKYGLAVNVKDCIDQQS